MEDEARAFAVGDDGAGGTGAQPHLLEAEAAQAGRSAGLEQPLGGPTRVEQRRRHTGSGRRRRRRRRQLRILVEEDLGDVEAFHLVAESGALEAAGDLGDDQLRARHVQRGEADVAARLDEPDQARHPGRLQQLAVDRSARAQNAGHVAPDEPARRHLAHLVPKDDAVPGVEEPAQVRGHRVMRDTAHGEAAGPAEPPSRQRHLEEWRRHLRVGAEEFVEVAKPRQDEGVWVRRLDRTVLAQDGGVPGVVQVDGGGVRSAGLGEECGGVPAPGRSRRGGELRRELPGADVDHPGEPGSPAAALSAGRKAMRPWRVRP